MRIAAFVHAFPSVSQTFVLNQLGGLSELGCEVNVFADLAEAPLVHPAAAGFLATHPVTYYNLPNNYLRRTLDGAALWKNLAVQSPVQARRTLNFFRYGVAALSLRLVYQVSALRQCGTYDIVHAHFGPQGLNAAQLREIGALDAPLVTTFYGYDTNQRFANAYRFLFAHGDLFLALSETMRAQLVRLGCDPHKIVVHPLGIDLKLFELGHGASHLETRIVSIARLVPKKGIEYGIRAVAELVRQNVKVHYTIIGDGPLDAPLQQLVETLKLRSQVTFVGSLLQPAVKETLREADILLAPSVTAADGDVEGTPVAILEAMAMGLPVVSTRHSGIPEIVNEGVTGILAPERDVMALSNALIRLIQSPAARATMGEAGRKYVQARHDICELNARLLGLYDTVR